MRKRTAGSWIALFVELALVVFVAVVSSFSLFTLANFSDNVNRFSFYVKTADAEMTKKELIGLHYFYDLSRKWKVQWLADEYLFRDAPFYEPADSYLIRDWEKVKEDLKEKLDDPRAYPYGNAKFRQAQIMYNAGKTKEAIALVLDEIHGDFEKALRVCLDSGVPYAECYDSVWNFDLTDNKKDAEEALKNPPPKVKFILGPPKEKDPILPMDKEKKPGGGKEGEEKPGTGVPRKRP